MNPNKRVVSVICISGSLVLMFLLCAAPAESPKTIHCKPFDIGAQFTASGWMGDGEQGTKYIELFEAWQENPHSKPACIKVDYKEFGVKGWGGIYWQNEPDNWGDKPGEDFSDEGFNAVTFWARGENGGEMIEFKAGGIDSPGKEYKDSFQAKAGKIVLEKEWRRYVIDLRGKDLSCVIGGFCWVATKAGNPNGLTFYLDDILFENLSEFPE